MHISLGKLILMHLNNVEEANFEMNNFYVPPLKPDEIYHFGIKRRSGRYPWGSGDRPYQSTEGTGSKHKKNTSGEKYEVKEVARLRTAISNTARSAAVTALGSVAGAAVGVGTQNFVLGLATFSAVTTGASFTPLGRKKVYFKNTK